jgi:ketosteroid isomerase-like protein
VRLEQALVDPEGCSNLEVVRRVFETGSGYIRGERGPFEAAVEELCAPDILVVPSSALASGDAGPFRGRDSLLHQQEQVGRQWAAFEVTAEDYVEVPPSTIVVLGKIAARREDGSGYAMEVGVVNRLEDGQIVEMHSYQSKGRALEAAGAADLGTGSRSD